MLLSVEILGVISTIGVWLIVTYTYVINPDWIHYGFMQFICFCLSATVLHVRRRNVVVNGQLRMSAVARVSELEAALQNIRVLEGMIPICAWCKKVRDDDGFWGDVERYVGTRTNAEFSHGVCPSCAKEYFKNEDKK